MDGGGQRFPGGALNGGNHAGFVHLIHRHQNPGIADHPLHPPQQPIGAVAGENGGLKGDGRAFSPQHIPAHGADHQLGAGKGAAVMGAVQLAQQGLAHQPGMSGAEPAVARQFPGQAGKHLLRGQADAGGKAHPQQPLGGMQQGLHAALALGSQGEAHAPLFPHAHQRGGLLGEGLEGGDGAALVQHKGRLHVAGHQQPADALHASAPYLLIAGKGEIQIRPGPHAPLQQRFRRRKQGDQMALHIRRAPAVNKAVPDFAGKGRQLPVFGAADGGHIQMRQE